MDPFHTLRRPGGVQWRAAVWFSTYDCSKCQDSRSNGHSVNISRPMPGDSQTPFVAQRPGGPKRVTGAWLLWQGFR